MKTLIWFFRFAGACRPVVLGFGLFAAALAPCVATPPTQIRADLAAGESIVFVDLRSMAAYRRSHIPGAINVPAALCAAKKLPPLGRVLVYDDGLSPRAAAEAAAALNQKPGIRAEVLDGGLPAWETLGGATTRRPGLEPERTATLTYAALKELEGPDVLLVDLRHPDADPRVRVASTSPGAGVRPLTDLQAEFPQARVVRSPFETSTARLASASSTAPTPPLLVLIDCNDGAAARMARTLKAQGITRFAILLGGESSLERRGEPGLQRRGTDLSVQLPANAALPLSQP